MYENKTRSIWSSLGLRLCSENLPLSLNYISILTAKRRLQNEDDSHRDFIHYVLKNKERFDITHEEIIANSSLFM